MRDLDGVVDSSGIPLSMPCREYYWVQQSSRIVLQGFVDTISIRDRKTAQVYLEFGPGPLVGSCSNADGSLFAYTTADNTLTILNTLTLQGVFSHKIDFDHDMLIGDGTSFGFLKGDHLMYIRDKQQNLHFLDIPARKVVAVVSPDKEWFLSSDGNNLFVLDTVYSRYDCFTGQRISRFPQQESMAKIVGFDISPSGYRVVTADSMNVHTWDLQSKDRLSTASYQLMQECHWSPDSLHIVFGHTDTSRQYHSFIVADAATLEKRFALDSARSLSFLGYSPGGEHVYFSLADTLMAFNTKANRVDDRWVVPGHASALHFIGGSDSVVLGTTLGGVWKLWLKDSKPVPWFDGWGPIVRLRMNADQTFLCVSSTDSVSIIRISDMNPIGRLSTRTKDDLFMGRDSLCLNIYSSAIVEFELSTGKAAKYDTETTPVFRPLGDFYACIGEKPNEDLSLVEYRQRHNIRRVRGLASVYDLRWSANSAAVAALDLYNNIAVWRPKNVETHDTTSDVVSYTDVGASLSVSPNPAANAVYVRLPEASSGFHTMGTCQNGYVADIVDELGRRCLRTTISCEEATLRHRIPLEGLSSGLYRVVVYGSECVFQASFVLRN